MTLNTLSRRQLLAALARRPRPIDPQLLNDRLVNARWSI